ncbi:MAG: hypothetical protein Q9183_000690, partial [Haloplaca sp. 2 TL-2023]
GRAAPISTIAASLINLHPNNNRIDPIAEDKNDDNTTGGSDVNDLIQDSESATAIAAKQRTAIIVAFVAVVTGINAFLSGLLVVAILTIKRDLMLEEGLVLCPSPSKPSRVAVLSCSQAPS